MMTRRSRRWGILIVLAGLGCLGAAASPAFAEAKLLVGTFDSRGIALAYGRSNAPDGMMPIVDKLFEDYEAAKAAGDSAQVAELEKAGPALQEKMHQQVFFGAPIDDILELLAEDLAKVAEAEGVALIVPEIVYRGPGVEVVDVTLPLARHFEPDDNTVNMIKQILAMPVPEPGEGGEKD